MRHFLILLMFFVISCKKETIPQVKEQSTPKVLVKQVELVPIKIKKDATGFVSADKKVEIKARVNGFLEQKLFKDGQKVKAGDKLFIIEQDEYKAKVLKATSDLEMAKASYEKDRLQYERAKELIKTKTISEAKYDEQSATYEVSKAKVGEAEANLKMAKLDLSYTEIVSPIDGTVSDSVIDEGNYISSTTSALTTVVNSDTVKVDFEISEKYAFKIIKEIGSIQKIGGYMQAVLILPDKSEYKEKGEIKFADVLINRKTNTLRLKAIFKNSDNVLKDGQYAKIYLETINPVPSVVIPKALVLVDQQGRFVYVSENNVAKVKRIKTEGNYGDYILVTEGLNVGDNLIVQGFQVLKPNTKVEVMSQTPAVENKPKTEEVKEEKTPENNKN